ncbi:hypothetical protein Dimus_021347 [Dionaea muscipula]
MLRDYDKLQSFAVILIYVQIGCALVGSLGASYNGVSLINLAIALFALVAIESGSQRLGRTYAILLISAILLDAMWLILFFCEIWHMSSVHYGVFFIFSVRLTLAMEIAGFTIRLSSSLLWIQMYRLGVSRVESGISRDGDYDLRSSFLNPSTPAMVRQSSDAEDLGGSIYDPAYYSSLFQSGQHSACSNEGCNHPGVEGSSSSSTLGSCKLNLSIGNVTAVNHNTICFHKLVDDIDRPTLAMDAIEQFQMAANALGRSQNPDP